MYVKLFLYDLSTRVGLYGSPRFHNGGGVLPVGSTIYCSRIISCVVLLVVECVLIRRCVIYWNLNRTFKTYMYARYVRRNLAAAGGRFKCG